MTKACAEIVQRDDPHLYATALFAPEPARSHLMVLYAFDCELSRAVRASKDSMIPRMRLQWWRDILEEAVAGAKPKAHDVAEPLARLFRLPVFAPGLEPAPFLAMVDGYEAELDAPFAAQGFTQWARRRFGGRIAAALALLGLQRHVSERLAVIADQVGIILAVGFALRTAKPRAMVNAPVLVPGLQGSQLADAARGRLSPTLQRNLISVGAMAREAYGGLKQDYAPLQRTLRPAVLPIYRELRVANRILADDFQWDSLADPDRPFDGLRLAIRAMTRRW
ncbi:MAG: squalene/phytoene synthase family protein [Pseudomonadota bacterium]